MKQNGWEVLNLNVPADEPKNKYLYNGKEFHNDNDEGLYNYGARFYDPAIARFTTVDPLAEQFPHQSGYVYADNDPGETSGSGSLIHSKGAKYKLKFTPSRPTTHHEYQNKHDPLHVNLNAATTASAWAKKYDGKSVDDVAYENTALFQSHSGGSSPRYVIDQKTGYVVDMKHFIKVGQKGSLFGNLGEYSQRNTYPNSAYHPQDIFSNDLGIQFCRAHASYEWNDYFGSPGKDFSGYDFPKGFAKAFETWMNNR